MSNLITNSLLVKPATKPKIKIGRNKHKFAAIDIIRLMLIKIIKPCSFLSILPLVCGQKFATVAINGDIKKIDWPNQNQNNDITREVKVAATKAEEIYNLNRSIFNETVSFDERFDKNPNQKKKVIQKISMLINQYTYKIFTLPIEDLGHNYNNNVINALFYNEKFFNALSILDQIPQEGLDELLNYKDSNNNTILHTMLVMNPIIQPSEQLNKQLYRLLNHTFNPNYLNQENNYGISIIDLMKANKMKHTMIKPEKTTNEILNNIKRFFSDSGIMINRLILPHAKDGVDHGIYNAFSCLFFHDPALHNNFNVQQNRWIRNLFRKIPPYDKKKTKQAINKKLPFTSNLTIKNAHIIRLLTVFEPFLSTEDYEAYITTYNDRGVPKTKEIIGSFYDFLLKTTESERTLYKDIQKWIHETTKWNKNPYKYELLLKQLKYLKQSGKPLIEVFKDNLNEVIDS